MKDSNTQHSHKKRICLIISLSSVILVALILTMVLLIEDAAHPYRECPNEEDYSPCTCPEENWVTCDRVPLADIQAIFTRTKAADIEHLTLSLSSSDTSIPDGLLGDNNRAASILIQCFRQGSRWGNITMDSDALRSSRNYTSQMSITGCDLSTLDFTFLDGFDQLAGLELKDSIRLHESPGWDSFPILPGLTSLRIEENGDDGLNSWTTLPATIQKLAQLSLKKDSLSDEGVERILNWASGLSASTIKELHLDSNGLTKIPSQIASFTGLETYTMAGQIVNDEGVVVLKDSLTFSSVVVAVDLQSSGISRVEAGAFQGNFSRANVLMAGNMLTRFEESSFRPLVTQMTASVDEALLTIGNNPFDCESDPCHLAWIVRDDRNLLKVLINAVCSNGTRFDQLLPEGLSRCE